jgi:hypothetical protein
MRQIQIALLLTAGLLTGCGGKVIVFGHTLGEAKNSAVAKSETVPAGQQSALATAATQTGHSGAMADAKAVSAIELVLSPAATAQAAADPRFKTDALLRAVTDELRARGLLDVNAATSGTADISIHELTVEPTSNAVLFGYILSDAKLSGTVSVREGHDRETLSEPIEAHVKLSVPAKDPSAISFDHLYRRFAVLACDRLAGVETPSELTSNQSHR